MLAVSRKEVSRRHMILLQAAASEREEEAKSEERRIGEARFTGIHLHSTPRRIAQRLIDCVTERK